MFRKYDCGCIGIAVNNIAWCIKPCDLDRYHPSEINMHRRHSLIDKEFTPLSERHVDELLVELAELIADGNGLRTLKHTLQTIGLVK